MGLSVSDKCHPFIFAHQAKDDPSLSPEPDARNGESARRVLIALSRQPRAAAFSSVQLQLQSTAHRDVKYGSSLFYFFYCMKAATLLSEFILYKRIKKREKGIEVSEIFNLSPPSPPLKT